MRNELPLFKHFPGLRKLAWTGLGRFPTRVHRLSRLERALGTTAEIWIKRDDESAEAYGGNKVRKLEFLLAEARRRGNDHLIAVGGLGSHHVLATAIYGRAAGMGVSAVLFEQPLTEKVRLTLRLVHSLGARLRLVPRLRPAPPWTAIPPALAAEYLRQRRLGCHPCLLPPGGSSPRGSLGYVNAALELKEQIEAGLVPEPGHIFIPLGSGGTMAGLVAGFKLAGLRSQVVGVRVVDRLAANATLVRRLARRTLDLIRRHGEPKAAYRNSPTDRHHAYNYEVVHEFFGGAYGLETPEAREAVELMAGEEGIQLETTYTGKALAALIAAVRSTERDQSKRRRTHDREGHGEELSRIGEAPILFWNTFSSADLSGLCQRLPLPSDLPSPFQRFFGGTRPGVTNLCHDAFAVLRLDELLHIRGDCF